MLLVLALCVVVLADVVLRGMMRFLVLCGVVPLLLPRIVRREASCWRVMVLRYMVLSIIMLRVIMLRVILLRCHAAVGMRCETWRCQVL